ncbi:MAG: valine--tRNA ligase [Chloroflexi bacterium]|mgnify:FL=1|jgi:valyl-tRNA synthetase|nr:valine--tRNA ligase [Chloroflexota bacterium]MBT3669824.1 valine--tRNA ligase [Chloroflexota bacterium]MBT4304725.1 valine--tRNA ligase [Chloroflexota bacterium]MBT4683857.1 valine--tRNA ligase [Chloroflexota bacterium]MBT4755549.1 valine--tRNA ligase [Chloroflexota bacterium]
MTKKMDLAKTYDFKDTEERIYKMWEENGYFKPTNDPNEPGHDPSIKPFVISIPPPNVTGELHLGHPLFVSLEDLMIRYHRMKGVPTLWVPGTDHAGIATQLQVEQYLLRTKEVTREEIGREEFLKHTWEWKEKYGGIITQQIRRLGASCDWDRERFTLDEGLSIAVKEAFVRLYNKGLIYRGPRLINWSPGLRTAVSDLEVEYHEEVGKLYFFKYKIKDSDEYIPVATTRPETILGDTAVAVHPEDQRYKNLIGKMAIVPMLGREIPVIADEYVDQSFGTGALKITPGHDPNDYEIGARHKLKVLSILNKDAKINENGGQYEGLDRFECREKIWKDMDSAGLVIKTEEHTHQVPRSQRGGEIIEPMISTQWFVDIQPLADKALAAVSDGRIKIVPEFFTKTYNNWLENIQDWCISRQLWWGHQIPVWYGPDGEKFCAHSEEEAMQQAKDHYGKETALEQDPDVLDTWFSSGLWPFSTLGWPEQTPDLKYFYPTSVLETGNDILFFWVVRMIMSGLEFTDDIPFDTVYLHGLVMDEHGQKMSKSKGNVIDPLKVIDQFGTDSLRFTLLVGSTPGKDMNISLKKVEANRNFANKLWNATRLVLSLLKQAPADADLKGIEWTLADSWAWAKLKDLTHNVDRLFATHQYGEAGRQIYEFFWSEFADWYLEIAKLQISEGGPRAKMTANALVRILDTLLRLLHPFTPFITEELWGYLKQASIDHSPDLAPSQGWEEALIIAKWPEPFEKEGWEEDKINEFELVMEIVRSIRNLRSEKQVKAGRKIPAIIVAGEQTKLIKNQAYAISALAHLDKNELQVIDSINEKPESSIALVVGSINIFLPLAGLVDQVEEKQRLEKELKEVLSQIDRLEKLLNSPFAEKAPPQVVEKEHEKLKAFKETAAKIEIQLSELG